MYAKKVQVLGRDLWINYSVRAEMLVEERGLDSAKIFKNPTNTGLYTMLWAMLESGYRWAKKQGEAAEKPPAFDDLADELGNDELAALVPVMIETIRGKRMVEAEPDGKKTKAGQTSDG